MNASRLRAIPSVEKVLQSLGDSGLPRPLVLDQVRRELSALRKQKTIPEFDAVVSAIRAKLRNLSASRIQPVINGTGILIHTNFGRAPLGPAVIEKLKTIGSNYNNLEYDLTGGARGGRAAYLERALSLLCSAEAATVVNNNAAALVLILRHFCGEPQAVSGRRIGKGRREARARKNEVIISRGELIQIGGGFRIPDILETSGARLREVGTTNHTSVGDYARAITPETALILKVHRSNFFMSGFVESPPPQEVAALARRKRIPFVEDLGSGAIVATEAARGSGTRTYPRGSCAPRRRSSLFQRRQTARRAAGRHHCRKSHARRRAETQSAISRAPVRQTDPIRAGNHRRYLLGLVWRQFFSAGQG